MYIDIHSHINDDRLIENVEEIIKEANKENVGIIVCVGYDYPSSFLALELSKKYDNIYAVIGMHPHDAKIYDDKMEKFLEDNYTNEKVIAIGEIGLDYHYDLSPREVQKEVFEKQIKLAHKFNLPIVVHTREACKDTYDILKANKELIHGGIIHCCGESLEMTKEFIKLGFSISLGGSITFKNNKNGVNLAKNIPLDKIMLETDCPYMTPEPFRGKINKPLFVKLVAEKIAEIREIPLEEVEQQTTKNALEVFKRIKNV